MLPGTCIGSGRAAHDHASIGRCSLDRVNLSTGTSPTLFPLLEPSLNLSVRPSYWSNGFGWIMQEVAELTGVKVTSVQNHLDRGLKKLRVALKVSTDG